MVYYNIDPFGNERGDYHAAQVSSIIAEVHRDRKKRKEPYRATDFMPKYGNEKPQQTAEQQIAFARMITIGMGGTVKNG